MGTLSPLLVSLKCGHRSRKGALCVCVFFFLRSFSERVWRAPISTNLVIGPVLYWENLCPLPVLSASSTRGKVC